MARRIMHIDLDAFFVSVEQVFDPSLRGKPVVVGGKPDQRGVVAACSYEARAYGIHSGMPLARAARLCPKAIFIAGNFARYRDASEKFMAILADFSPFLEPMGIDEAYLDVTGFESLHGSVREMARKIKKRVKDEIGICASVGIASSKIVAKVASKQSKPDGLIEVPTGGEKAFLAPLPIDKLPGIGEKTQKVLKELGIHTLGELATVPLDALKSRFGIYAETIHAHANGIGSDVVEPPTEAKSTSRSTTFPQDTRDIQFIKATLRYLTERVGNDLREKGKLAKCVHITVRYADFTTITRQRTVSPPTDADQLIFDTALDLLKRELTAGKKQAVRLVGIGASSLVAGRQLNLLDPTPRRLEKLNAAIDRIREKYGFTSIQTGRTLLLRDIFPESERGYTLHTPGCSR